MYAATSLSGLALHVRRTVAAEGIATRFAGGEGGVMSRGVTATRGDGALYATVTGIRRPERLACSGPMGLSGPVAGVFAMDLEERPDGTLVRLSHQVLGPVDDEARSSYERGWVAVFDALRGHLGLAG